MKTLSLLLSAATWVAPLAPAQTHTWSTLAGTAGQSGSADGTAGAARFNFSRAYLPHGIVVEGSGTLYVADIGNHTVRKITAAGVVTTFAGSAGQPGSVDGPAANARFNQPAGVALDRADNLVVADSGNHTIRRISSAGIVTTLAGRAGQSGSSDGPADNARFNRPAGIAVDAAGNVYVTDYDNSTLRKITPAGVVSTLAGRAGEFGGADGTGAAARLAGPAGIAIDGNGSIFIAEVAHRIRKVTAEGVVTEFAGAFGQYGSTDGTASAARFSLPRSVAIDPAGNVLVADGNGTIRTITPAGAVTTVGGSSTQPGSVDGTGTDARFGEVSGIAVDSAGNLYVIDSGNSTIRKGVPAASTGMSRIANLSVRSLAGTDDATLIVGFSIAGNDAKPVLVRAIGPTLATFGVTGVLPNPNLRVDASDGRLIAQNDDWLATPGMGIAATLTAAMSSVGAFPLSEDSRDAVVLQVLTPGGYTAQVGGGTGIALVELYDAAGASSARLVNVSARTRVGTAGEVLIAGFVLAGTAPKRILIRAIGPTLGSLGVSGALADPRLDLAILSGARVAENDDWAAPTGSGTPATAGTMSTAFGQAGAFALPATSKDAALLVTLEPGAYTASVSGVGGAGGVALVEVYELP